MDKRNEKDIKYYQQINYENTLCQQMNRIAAAYTSSSLKEFNSAVIALSHLMPPKTKPDIMNKIKELGLDNKYLCSDASDMQAFFELWDYCSNVLDKCGLLFKQSYGVQEYGHD